MANKNKLRVLHIATIDFTLKKMIADKMLELKKYNYEIDLMSDDTGMVEDVKRMGFKHIKLKMSRRIHPLQDLISILKLFKFLKSNHYDIVHTHTAKAGVIGRIAARLAGVKIVVHTSHGLPFYQGQPRMQYQLYRMLEKTASYFSDGYFSQNKEDIKHIKQMVPRRVLVGYEGNGIPLPKLDQYPKLSEDQKEALKNELGIKDEEFVFIMAARFEPVKNHQMLFEALSRIQVKNLKVVLVGLDSQLEKIRDKAFELNVDQYLLFLGYRDDIFDLIQISDAAILTSEKEGIPRFLMESMAFGKPVLATNVLGTKELVVHGETGELVELNNYSQLAEHIEKWIKPEYKSILHRYGIKARMRIEQNFTEAIVAQRIHHFYEELMSKVNGNKRACMSLEKIV